jgi:hypothetical protein
VIIIDGLLLRAGAEDYLFYLDAIELTHHQQVNEQVGLSICSNPAIIIIA